MADQSWLLNTLAKASAAPLDGTEVIRVINDPAGTPESLEAAISDIRAYIIVAANIWAATQTITPAANTPGLVVSGYSLTGANAQTLADLSGTWNTSGSPTGFKLNITNTASGSAAKLFDWQISAASVVEYLKGVSGGGTSGVLRVTAMTPNSQWIGFLPRDDSAGKTWIWSQNKVYVNQDMGCKDAFTLHTGGDANPVNAGSPDVGIARNGAGLLKITNGASGSGKLNILAGTLAGLGSAATAGANTIAIVTDATAPVTGTDITGGGAVRCLAISDGTNWKAA